MAGANHSNEEERENAIGQMSYLQQMYNERHALITQEIKGILETVQEMNNALSSLNAVDQIGKRSAMMHMGSDVYTLGTVGEMKTVILGIGGDYLVEKGVDDAKTLVSGRVERYNKALQTLMKERSDLENALVEISYKLESMQV
jgi:prefoldin alpha subunit